MDKSRGFTPQFGNLLSIITTHQVTPVPLGEKGTGAVLFSNTHHFEWLLIHSGAVSHDRFYRFSDIHFGRAVRTIPV